MIYTRNRTNLLITTNKNYERIRKFTILEQPFTIEGGEMTPSLKLKRKVIEERYTNLIEDMYEGKM